MDNWQNWAVAVVLLLCAFRMVKGFYSFYRNIKEKRTACNCCANDCGLKHSHDKEEKDCCRNHSKEKKNCCG